VFDMSAAWVNDTKSVCPCQRANCTTKHEQRSKLHLVQHT